MSDIEAYAASKGWQTKQHTSPSGPQIQIKHCPFCGGGEHRDAWTFALNAESGAYVCKRGGCQESGSFTELQRELGDKPMRTDFRPRFIPPPKQAKSYKKPRNEVEARHDALLTNPQLMAYLTTTKQATKTDRKGKEVQVQGRGFTLETIKRFQLGAHTGKIADHEATWLSIPYFRNGELVRQKYRTVAKDFGLDYGSEPYLFGRDRVQGTTTLIAEGEFDVLAWDQCGIPYAVSVPDGCSDTNWIDHNWDWLEGMDTVYIATDADEGGRNLEREIVTRLGRDRCLRIDYPEGLKDANACIQSGMSSEAVRALVEAAKPYPLAGLYQAADLYDEVWALYNETVPAGYSTGWAGLDRILGGIRLGEVTVVTGVPGSGKSEFVSALQVNLARQGVKSVVASLENPAKKVIRNQVCQYLGKPFHGHIRMTPTELQEGVLWLHDRILYVDLDDEDQDWETVEEHFRYAARRYGCKVAIADPLTMLLGEAKKDDERFRIDGIMRRARRLVKSLEIHLIIIAHPTKLASDDAVAQLYNINGSAGVPNLTWNGISVWRNGKAEAEGRNEVNAYVLKNREFGIKGSAPLLFDSLTKRYRDNANPMQAEEVKPKRFAPPKSREIVRSFTEPDPPPALPFTPPEPRPFVGTETRDMSDFE